MKQRKFPDLVVKTTSTAAAAISMLKFLQMATLVEQNG